MNNIKNRKMILLISLILVLTVAAGSTLAVLSSRAANVTNTFIPGTVDVTVTEEFDGTIKSKVQLVNPDTKDNSSVKAYIRAQVIITWQDSTGNVYAEAPVEDTHYTIDYAGGKWVQNGEYWYYTEVVEPGGSTDNLINTCTWTAAGPDGYTLHVEILGEAIQAVPADAVQEAWGVTISNGSVTPVVQQ